MPAPAHESPTEGSHITTVRLWTADDVARFLSASRSWVYQRAEAGLLPCLRIGGLLRFDPKVIKAHARGQR